MDSCRRKSDNNVDNSSEGGSSDVESYHYDEHYNQELEYRVIEPSIAQAAPLNKKRLKIHLLLRKAESALATQIRTGKTGLANFLHKSRVPGVTSPACPCGWHRKTPEHVIMFCRLISGRKAMLREAGTKSYQALTESPKPLKTLTAWLMKSGMLSQFSLAVQPLYQQ